MTHAMHFEGHRYEEQLLSAAEVTTVAAICNRLARMLGTVDREGIFADFEIVQSNCPLDLAALAAAPDRVFVEEMSKIIEATDRRTRSLRGGFNTRFVSNNSASRLF
ncbi:MAG: hypothetical protein AAGL66_00255 [Pseudomonadota bacterium]